MFGKVLCVGCATAILGAGGGSILGLLVLGASPVGAIIPFCVGTCIKAFS